jgi:hypothetical protein
MTLLADLLVPFCDACSLNIKDVSRTVKKRFIVSISFVDTASLHQNLFKDHYLDWPGVHEYLQEITYTVSDWIELIRILDFVQELTPPPEVTELISTTMAGVKVPASQTKAFHPIESLRICFAKIKMAPSWDLLCKTFLACNLLDIDQVQILSALFGEHCAGDSPAAIEHNIRELVRFMASCKHTKTEYTDILSAILSDARCQVRSHIVIQSLKKRDALKEERQNDAIRSGAAFRKPSLTQLLERKCLSEGAKHPQDSFASFCRSSKIASNVNLRIKQTAYFLLCLPEGSAARSESLARVLGGDMILLANIQSMAILSPDVQELRKIIMETHYTTNPTEAIRNFKEKCVSNCLVSMSRGLNWTTVMRLYLAAYCRDEIRKDLWCYVLSKTLSQPGEGVRITPEFYASSSPFLHTSPETESTVQNYVRGNPIVLNDVVEIMLMDL